MTELAQAESLGRMTARPRPARGAAGLRGGGARLLRRAARARRAPSPSRCARAAAPGSRSARRSCTSASWRTASRPRARRIRAFAVDGDAELDALAARLEAAGRPGRVGRRSCRGPPLLHGGPVGQPRRATSALAAGARPRRGRRAARAVRSRAPAAGRRGARAACRWRDDVRDRRAGEAPDAARQVAGWIQRELCPGSVETITSSWRRGSQVSATASIGFASPMPSASMPASRQAASASSSRSRTASLPGEPGTLARHEQRDVDRALLGALLDRVDQVARGGGDVGEDEHVGGHRRLLAKRDRNRLYSRSRRVQ